MTKGAVAARKRRKALKYARSLKGRKAMLARKSRKSLKWAKKIKNRNRQSRKR
jgi:hypothetical protein